jgi:hypothetical protein
LPLTAERAAAILFLMAAAPSAPLVLGMLAACRELAAPAAAFPHSNAVVPVMIFLVSCQILLLPLSLGAGSLGMRAGGVLLLLATVGGGVSFFDTQITDGGAVMGCALAFAGISAAASYLWMRHEIAHRRRSLPRAAGDGVDMSHRHPRLTLRCGFSARLIQNEKGTYIVDCTGRRRATV